MNTFRRLTPALALFLISAAHADLSHRQSQLTILVQTSGGEPLQGAEVDVQMLNHAFRFGTSVENGHIDPDSADAWVVQELQKYFNSITFGNIMKWSYYEDRMPETMLDIVANAMSYKAFNGPDAMRVRGHATIWGASYQVPADVRNSSDPDFIHERIIEHVSDYHTTFKDAGIDNFDLYNEHFHEPALLIDKIVPSHERAAQAAEVATWFNAAKEADPEAVLFINDYNILNFWNSNDADVIEYKTFVDAVRDAGGQIDGIGLQGHMDRPTTTKADITRRLDILAAPMPPTANYPDGLPGLRIEITELDMNVDNAASNNPSWENATPEEQAQITENVLEAAFEHPSVDGITIWGINDYFHWRDNAIMFDDLERDGTTRTRIEPVLKQSGQVWIDHVTDEWWTDLSGSTDAQGQLAANVFKGAHKIAVTFEGETKELTQTVSEDGEIVFEFSFSANDSTSYDQWAEFFEWENAEAALREADADGDLRSNFEEYVAATDPQTVDQNKTSRFLNQGDGSFLLEYSIRSAHSGLTVAYQISEDLVNWGGLQYLGPELVPEIENGVATFQLPITPSDSPSFYRVTIKDALSDPERVPTQAHRSLK